MSFMKDGCRSLECDCSCFGIGVILIRVDQIMNCNCR